MSELKNKNVMARRTNIITEQCATICTQMNKTEVKKVEKIVKYWVNKFLGRGLPKDVLIVEAHKILWECVKRFDKTKGADFKTYLTRRMSGGLTNYLNDECHKWYQQNRKRVFVEEESLDCIREFGDDGKIMKAETIEDKSPAEAERREEQYALVDRLLGSLDHDDRELMVKKFRLDGDTDGFEKLRKRKYKHLSDGAFNRKCERIVEKMRKYAVENGLKVIM